MTLLQHIGLFLAAFTAYVLVVEFTPDHPDDDIKSLIIFAALFALGLTLSFV